MLATRNTVESMSRDINKNEEILTALQQILQNQKDLNNRFEKLEKNQKFLNNGQATIVQNQQQIADKIEQIESNISLKAAEMLAQTQILMECRVAAKNEQQSIYRITGNKRDAKLDELVAMLPLRSLEAVKDIEEKLESEDFVQTMLKYTYKLKGVSEDISSVIRGIFTDDLLEMYNWEGRCEKQSIANLKLCNIILREVFQEQISIEFEKGLKKAIERSHHRSKQKRYLKKSK